jgi:hypothetical protein
MNKFSVLFPHITWWIENHGWIELGADEYSNSLIRLVDEGGIYWEDKKSKNLDNALQNTEKFLVADLPERFGDTFN